MTGIYLLVAILGAVALLSLFASALTVAYVLSLDKFVKETFEAQSKMNKSDIEAHRHFIAALEKLTKKVLTIGGEVERLKMAAKDKK